MPRWPLAFSLQAPKLTQNGQQSLQALGVNSIRPLPKHWWSHRLYRGPDNAEIQIIYSRTKDRSEAIARQFLNETVVGFDMEWPWNDWKKSDLQNKIGLIQIAAEDKIALFHIGLHPGKTADDIIAPSLRKLIEDPNIGKLGVGVLNADFSRLHRFFGLQPKGAVELSHLYRLVKYGARKPELVSTKMVSLANQVEDQLGYPLYKGDVRTSNWSKPLSQDQIDYAAGDAYAGFMLYHCMNAKRLKMNPVPPLPIHADAYQSLKFSKISSLRLQALEADGSFITSDAFFGVPMKEKEMTRLNPKKKEKSSQVVTDETAVAKKKTNASKSQTPAQPLDAIAQGLYNELVICRSTLAKTARMPAYVIAKNAVLEALACKRPLDNDALLNIKGIGKVQQEKYGSVWLEVISQFLSTNGLPHSAVNSKTTSSTTSSSITEHVATHVPSPLTTQRKIAPHDSSLILDAPSLTLSSTTLTSKRSLSSTSYSYSSDSSSSSSSSLPSLKFTTPPPHQRRPISKRKRTTPSPLEEKHPRPPPENYTAVPSLPEPS